MLNTILFFAFLTNQLEKPLCDTVYVEYDRALLNNVIKVDDRNQIGNNIAFPFDPFYPSADAA